MFMHSGLIRIAATVAAVIAPAACAAADLRQFSNRTIKCADGKSVNACLSIEDDRRVVFQNNTSGFNGIWRVQETEQGWLISREVRESDKKSDPQPKLAYLSYVTTALKKDAENEKPRDMIFLSETPLPNSYWKLEISRKEGREFDCQIRPMCGEYDEWYVTAGEDISGKKTPAWHKKFAVILAREKPEKPVRCLVDGL